MEKWLPFIISFSALAFSLYTYIIHDKKIKKQSSLINEFQIEKNQKEKEENKKAIIEANKSFIKVISQGEPLKNELSFYTDAFYQEDKRSSGFGLGLYIVKTIVNLHKFSLDYEYVDGKNCFIIKILNNS